MKAFRYRHGLRHDHRADLTFPHLFYNTFGYDNQSLIPACHSVTVLRLHVTLAKPVETKIMRFSVIHHGKTNHKKSVTKSPKPDQQLKSKKIKTKNK